MTDYKIGEVARLLGLTTQALRFYEQEGVVTPKKSENGTRYYDEDQLILLLSFKKYRQADFSVQDIVTHFFKEDDLSGLRGQTLARRDMLLEQSALLRRRAEAFGAFEARLAYAQRHLDEPTLCERPLLHMLSPSLSELDFVDFKSRDSLEQFIAAMPRPQKRAGKRTGFPPLRERRGLRGVEPAACAHAAAHPGALCAGDPSVSVPAVGRRGHAGADGNRAEGGLCHRGGSAVSGAASGDGEPSGAHLFLRDILSAGS